MCFFLLPGEDAANIWPFKSSKSSNPRFEEYLLTFWTPQTNWLSIPLVFFWGKNELVEKNQLLWCIFLFYSIYIDIPFKQTFDSAPYTLRIMENPMPGILQECCRLDHSSPPTKVGYLGGWRFTWEVEGFADFFWGGRFQNKTAFFVG